MNLSDIFKKGFLEGMQEISPLQVGVTIGLAFIIGIFIYFIYRVTFQGVVFVKSFGTSLIMLCMVTAVVIIPIFADLRLSIGMVGALSIVRFRTAVKDTIDTIFMFWAIAAGIALGAQLYAIAGIGALIVGGLLVVWNLFKPKRNFPFMLVLRFDESVKKEVQNMLHRMPPGRLKSKVVSQGTMELTIELNIREDEVGVIDAFSAIPGVHDASLISYKGDIVS